MASVENQLLLIAYITLAAVIAMVYGMRRIFLLEKKIIRMEKRMLSAHHLSSSTKRKSTAKRKTAKRKTATKKKRTKRRKKR